ncbi:MAG: sensor domain-containing diguanylate cyclase [Sneathiellales bacterium]|nr:sensor domain-containing diguanylate cyclase [Sneathiellales bacterium]
MNEVTGKLTGLAVRKPHTPFYKKLWNFLRFRKTSRPPSIASLYDPLAYAVLDSLQEQIAVIDSAGTIRFVNSGWKDFARNNDCRIEHDWIGINYLDVCKAAHDRGDDFGKRTYEGILSVISRKRPTFSIEYPCHSPTVKRWFIMTIAGLSDVEQPLYSVCHRDITERRLAEERAQKLARTDELTGLSNRRQFNEYLENEWRRSMRQQTVLTIMVLDLDHFKELNDIFGHQVGDEHLKAVGEVLKTYAHRAGDICARLGGDEFVVIFENLTLDDTQRIAGQILCTIKSLEVKNPEGKHHPVFACSMGIIRQTPNQGCSLSEFIEMADQNLYRAKKDGGDTYKLENLEEDQDNGSLRA